MVIKASAASEIRQLVDALEGSDDVRREAAIARLGIIGPRAVDRLLAAYRASSTREVKIAVFRALEVAGDGRTAGLAREGLKEGGDVACAAVAALAGLLEAPHPPAAAEALDLLVESALNRAAERRVRLAAFQAIQHLPQVGPRIAAALRQDADAVLTAAADDVPRDRAAAEAVWQDAVEGRLPETPGMLRDLIVARASGAAATVLLAMIDAVRAREGSLPEGAGRDGWRAVRGALHQGLALRGSRVAVYDLRETVEQARVPLPVSFLAALHVVGDDSCLEPLAAAWTRSEDERWRHHLGAAFRAVIKREKITRRHAAFRRIASRWPDAAAGLTGRGQ